MPARTDSLSEPTSGFEQPNAKDLYTVPQRDYDEQEFQPPVPELPGETFTKIERMENDALIALSQYRIIIKTKKKLRPIPLGLVESFIMEELTMLAINTKQGFTYRCQFKDNEQCTSWNGELAMATAKLKEVRELFPYRCHAFSNFPDHSDETPDKPGFADIKVGPGYNFTKEIERLGLTFKNGWKNCELNKNFEVCPTYPKEHVIPDGISDEQLKEVANFRSSKRFPSVVWRDVKTGAVLLRASQPEVGWWTRRSPTDEGFLTCVRKVCQRSTGSREGSSEVSDDKYRLLILDARSYTAAQMNRAKGGGVERPDYYQDCDITFENLVNIHTVRNALEAVRKICHPKTAAASYLFMSALENCQWMQYISALLKSAWRVAHTLHYKGRPVLVHCSDGWDRTPQLVSLAELIIDPYYRTCEGFRILIEREWLLYGHKFHDRCHDEQNERSPVFLQWLDCVHQLLLQYPTAFEFNQTFLLKLVHHSYAKLFGTFLFNTERERLQHNVHLDTYSVWSFLNSRNSDMVQPLYDSSYTKVLRPHFTIPHLHFWRQLFLSDEYEKLEEENQMETSLPNQAAFLNRTHSCENLSTAGLESPATLTRQHSDPNISGEKKLTKTGSGAELEQENGELLEPQASASKETLLSYTQSGSSTLSQCSVPSDPGVGQGETEGGRAAEGSSQEEMEMQVMDASGAEAEQQSSGELAQVHASANTQDGDCASAGMEGDDHALSSSAKDDHASSSSAKDDVSAEIQTAEQNIDTKLKQLANRPDEIKVVDSSGDKHIGAAQAEPTGHGSASPDQLTDGAQFPPVTQSLSDDLTPTNAVVEDCELAASCDTSPNPATESPSVHSTVNGVPSAQSTMNGDLPAQLAMNGTDPAHSAMNGDSSVRSSVDPSVHFTMNGDPHVHLTMNRDGPAATAAVQPTNHSTPHVHQLDLTEPEAAKSSPNPMAKSLSMPSTSVAPSPALSSKAVGPSLALSSLAAANSNSISTSTSELSSSSTCPVHSHSSDAQPPGNCELMNGTHSNGRITNGVQHMSREVSGNLSRQFSLKESMSGTLSPNSEKVGDRCPLDIDGLEKYDTTEQQMMNKCQQYEDEIHRLQEELKRVREEGSMRYQYLDVEGGSEDHSLVSEHRSTTSESSYDKIDETDAGMQLWIPDHAVHACADCYSKFSFTVRRHHCRSCGRIFCATCSNQFTVVPKQHITEPQRVCHTCFQVLTSPELTPA